MERICSVVKNTISFYLILNILIQAVPGEKYRKYVKVFGGFLMLVCLLGELPFLQKMVSADEFSKLTQQYVQKLNDYKGHTEKLENITLASTLSTMESEIKTRINKCKSIVGYSANAVKIEVCEDTESGRFGEIEKITVYMGEYVDKTVNISVNKIIVRQNKTNSENEKEVMLKNVIAEELGVEPDVVFVCLD